MNDTLLEFVERLADNLGYRLAPKVDEDQDVPWADLGESLEDASTSELVKRYATLSNAIRERDCVIGDWRRRYDAKVAQLAKSGVCLNESFSVKVPNTLTDDLKAMRRERKIIEEILGARLRTEALMELKNPVVQLTP